VKAPELKAEGLARIAGLLEPEGWERVGRRTAFRRPQAPRIDAVLDFNCTLRNSPVTVDLTPYAGIVHADIEKARKAITGKSYYALNVQLQTLLSEPPSYTRWLFTPKLGTEAAAQHLVADALECTPAFFSKFHDLDDVVRELEAIKMPQRTIPGESRAIAYALQGRTQDALNQLTDLISAARSGEKRARAELKGYAALLSVPALADV
jgi:hypothetical protein